MAEPRQRIDQWLWFARIVKSRSQAARLVSDGQVRVNKTKIGRPSHAVGAGDVLTVAVHGRVAVLAVVGCGKRRGPAAEARLLYQFIESSDE